ncbi:platelet-activating factor acetylhydrolase-like isoform X2 [Clytia hemisphaerica]|uniref:platelet-activating factor acetylhydrolase-like isoform X2 n=1 Tax=Clytia hemisphaerica TaxID=252671 RepID=UPI0034D7339F
MGLPKPSGPFVVGCADIMTKVVQMPTNLTCPSSVLEKGVDFGMFARIYYPTEDESSKHYKEAKILPDEQTSLYASSMFSIFKLKWLSGLASFALRGALQHSFIDAPLIPQSKYDKTLGLDDETNKKFPLVVFSHGLIGFRHIYSTFCSDLASHGYVVASVEHRDGSALPTYFMDPETNKATSLPYMDHPTTENADEEIIQMRNKQVNRRAEEVSKLLDLLHVVNKEPEIIENLFPSTFDLKTLKGRLDVEEPLIIGHSFGGATTLNSINKDDRFKCAIVLDPWFLPLTEDEFYESGLKKPTFTIFTERFNWNKNIQRCQRFLDGLPKGMQCIGTSAMDQASCHGFYVLSVNSPVVSHKTMTINKELSYNAKLYWIILESI